LGTTLKKIIMPKFPKNTSAFQMGGSTFYGKSPLKEGDFKSAFAKARKEKGADGTFTWKNKEYSTARADDPSMHGQEMKRTKGKLHTIKGHSWSTGDKKQNVKDPFDHTNKKKHDYPSDDKKYHYVKDKDGLKITGSSPANMNDPDIFGRKRKTKWKDNKLNPKNWFKKKTTRRRKRRSLSIKGRTPMSSK
jgi:hypothetical protein